MEFLVGLGYTLLWFLFIVALLLFIIPLRKLASAGKLVLNGLDFFFLELLLLLRRNRRAHWDQANLLLERCP